MYTALRAMAEHLDRVRAAARDRQRDLPRAGPARPGGDRRRSAARRSHRVAGFGRRARAGRGSRRCACTACSVDAHDTDRAFQDVVVPEVPRPDQIELPPEPDSPNPFGPINFHEQTEWRPVSPLDDPGVGRFMSWVRLKQDALLPDGTRDPLVLAVHGDVLGPAVGRGLGSSRERAADDGALARDRHPVHRDAGHAVGAPGDRGLACGRRLRHRARALVGRRAAAVRDRDADRAPRASSAATLRPPLDGL